MKSILIVLASVILLSGGFLYAYSEMQKPMMQNNGSSMMDMCQTMMNSIPQDVVIRTVSSQVVSAGEESLVTLLVTDRKTGNPVTNAEVILHIEKGGPMQGMNDMSMMDMMAKMFEAENIGSGKYIIRVNADEKGYHTMHTHAIPEGKSMMSMMNNHMDIGIIAK